MSQLTACSTLLECGSDLQRMKCSSVVLHQVSLSSSVKYITKYFLKVVMCEYLKQAPPPPLSCDLQPCWTIYPLGDLHYMTAVVTWLHCMQFLLNIHTKKDCMHMSLSGRIQLWNLTYRSFKLQVFLFVNKIWTK